MKSKYRLALSLGLLALVAPSLVRADSIFTASGTFQDNSTLSGTLTIDTSTGLITAAALIVQYNISPSLTEHFTDILGQTGPASVDLEGDHFSDVFLYIDALTLMGYTGGPICSTTVACVGSVVSEVSPANGITGVPFNDFLVSGTLTAPSATPEPPTMVLLGASLLGLTVALGKKGWA
jgi:hypothetical protein